MTESFIHIFFNIYGKFLTFILFAVLLKGYNLNAKRFGGENISHDVVHNYLMEFGYLPKSDIETGNLRTEEQWKEAIKSLQKFGNVAQTGEIDELTRKLIKRPRCGVSDKLNSLDFSPNNLEFDSNSDAGENQNRKRNKRFVLQGSKWDHTDLTWSLVNRTFPDLDTGQVRRVLTDALTVWAKNSKLTFREILSEHADIQVVFARKYHGDGYDFDGPGQVLAHAFYPGNGRGGDVHFDADETWMTREAESVYGGVNLLGVAVHEFGHSLGLGHSSVEGAIMFPWYQGFNLSKPLPDDDRLAIQQLYPRREKEWGPYNPNRFRPVIKSTTSTTTTQRRYYPDHRPRDREPHRNRPRDPTHNHNHHYHHRYHDYTTTRATTTIKTIITRKPYTEPTKRFTTKYPKNNIPYHKPTEDPANGKPDTCNTSYDAIAMIRGELFIFKDKYLWRIGDRGLYNGYPHETKRLWTQLPESFTHVDAVYENKDMKIVFFIGKEYYVFNSNILESGYPQPLTNLGLPNSLRRIDASLIWGYNNRTYLYSDTRYWRLDEEVGKVELDYPRDMSIWHGIGYHIDAAFQYRNGKTYFFKGKEYWEFDDIRMKVAHIRPKISAHKWMQCPRVHDYDYIKTERNSALVSSVPILTNRSTINYNINLVLIIFLLNFCIITF